MKKFKYLLPLMAVLFSGIQALADGVDTTLQKKRPKVGLVLSGGGAKGFAHLGAIKVIEEAGVHIDYIGGTSIGAIVGGLYAAGWTTEQVDSLIRNFDMMSAVQDKVERRYRQYYDKQTEGKIWFRLGMLNGKLQFPSAISRGQNIINLFADWTIPVHDATDFDQLYIPYFAKATDLSHGTSVRLDKGYLPEAMRASGTFPSLLTPFKIDSCTYIDGGVLDNYPIDEMRRMGADIVVGININSGLSSSDQLNSIVGVLDQIISFQMVKNVEEQRPHLDLEINPDISQFGVMSFSAADSIYRKGEEAARQQMDALKQIAEMQKGYHIPERSRPQTSMADKFQIEDIRVEGSKDYPKAYFIGRMGKALPDEFSLDDIRHAISRLYATGNFDNVYYRLRRGSSPQSYILDFIVKENPVSQYIGVGWGYDKLYGINLLLNVRANNAMHHIMRRSVFETDLVLGMSPSLRLSLFRDNGTRPSFGINAKIGRLKVETNLRNVTADAAGEVIPFKLRTEVQTDYIQANAFAQATINQRYTFGVGVEYLYMKAIIDNFSFSGYGAPRLENTYFFAPNIYVSGDTRDDKFFPTKGSYFNVMYKVLLYPEQSGDDYMVETAKGKYQSFVAVEVDQSIPLAKYFTLGLQGYAGLAFTEKLPFAYRFFPGGIRASMPFNYVEFYGLPFLWNSRESSTDIGQNSFVKAAVRFQYSPGRNQYITAVYNYGLASASGTAFKATYKQIHGMGGGYAISTPIGRLQLIGTYSPDKKTGSNFGLFFSAGFTF